LGKCPASRRNHVDDCSAVGMRASSGRLQVKNTQSMGLAVTAVALLGSWRMQCRPGQRVSGNPCVQARSAHAWMPSASPPLGLINYGMPAVLTRIL
jgi:hypothetical protein